MWGSGRRDAVVSVVQVRGADRTVQGWRREHTPRAAQVNTFTNNNSLTYTTQQVQCLHEQEQGN